MVVILSSPSSFCSPHDRPINWETLLLEQGITTLIRKLADGEDGRQQLKKPASLSLNSGNFYIQEGRGGVHYGTNQWLSRTAKSTNQLLSASAGQAERCNSRKGWSEAPCCCRTSSSTLRGERHASGRDHSGHAEAVDMLVNQDHSLRLRVLWDQLTSGPSSPLVPTRRPGSWCPGAELPPAHLPSGWVVGADWPSGPGGA